MDGGAMNLRIMMFKMFIKGTNATCCRPRKMEHWSMEIGERENRRIRTD